MVLEALFTTVRFPVAGPATLGVNCNVAVALCPGPTEMGRPTFTGLNAALDIVSCEIVIATEPVFMRTKLCIAFDPTDTLPKFIEEAFAERAPEEVVALFEVVPGGTTFAQPDIQKLRQTATKQQAPENARNANLHICLV